MNKKDILKYKLKNDIFQAIKEYNTRMSALTGLYRIRIIVVNERYIEIEEYYKSIVTHMNSVSEIYHSETPEHKKIYNLLKKYNELTNG